MLWSWPSQGVPGVAAPVTRNEASSLPCFPPFSHFSVKTVEYPLANLGASSTLSISFKKLCQHLSHVSQPSGASTPSNLPSLKTCRNVLRVGYARSEVRNFGPDKTHNIPAGNREFSKKFERLGNFLVNFGKILCRISCGSFRVPCKPAPRLPKMVINLLSNNIIKEPSPLKGTEL